MVIASFEKDYIQISKLENAEHYRAWAIYVQHILENKAMWEIVDGTIPKPMLSLINAT